jgi:uncharacterized membrane protein YoaK (UPF0700 family)
MSGTVDAVSFLGLGHVFTANMTGNVLVLGFAAAGASGFSVTASLTSVGAFVVGAVLATRISRLLGARRRRLLTALATEAALAGVAAAVAASGHHVGTGGARYVVIALLALAMGFRNATVRSLAVSDVATNVLTTTLTGLAADSPLAGRDDGRGGRRLGAVVAMVAGAFVGAWLELHRGVTVPLVVVAVVVGAMAVAVAVSPAARALDER